MTTGAMQRVHFVSTDSTNAQARRLAESRPETSWLVVADEQTAGRGRLGRAWQSPRGGAWLSVAWPMRRPLAAYASASIVAAVATLEAIIETAPACDGRLQIKWPNDLLIDDRKAAGILCEQAVGASDRAVLVVGVGINVNNPISALGGSLRHPAISLSDAVGRCLDVAAVVDAVARRLEAALTSLETRGLEPQALEVLRARLAYVGAVRSIQQGDRTLTGCIQGVDETGALIVVSDAGELRLAAGEVLTPTLPTT